MINPDICLSVAGREQSVVGSNGYLKGRRGHEPGFEDHLHSEHVQAFEDEIPEYLLAERDSRKFHVDSVEQLAL